ncbi:hypothetical protein CCLMGIMDO_CCLMGIMDO_00605 [Companilactobacillus crustorum]
MIKYSSEFKVKLVNKYFVIPYGMRIEYTQKVF